MSGAAARYRGVLAYDGTHYFGFQRQAGSTPTIQASVEAALEQVTGQRVTVIGAGRTDTGVHATGQVIAFDVAWRHTPHDLWRALNATLPPDVALQTLEEAAAHFHPRFDARSRMYEYTVYVAPVRQPCLSRYAWHVPYREPLDLAALQAAAGRIVGTHDFATFGSPPWGSNTTREVLRSEWALLSGSKLPDGQMIRYQIEANAFLYRMVRRLVGALVRVGAGEITPDEFEAALCAADGTWPNRPAPACGLCLTQITY